MGLSFGHAYSVLRVVTRGKVQLVQLRNPWARQVLRTEPGCCCSLCHVLTPTITRQSWRGDWSDDSPLWDVYAGLRDELGPHGGSQGGRVVWGWEMCNAVCCG